jgi:hypothetical protein
MAGKNTAVFGIYLSEPDAANGVDALKAAGFRNTDISALFPENQGTKDFAHEKSTKAPEGATAGAGTGALLGGGLGWLAWSIHCRWAYHGRLGRRRRGRSRWGIDGCPGWNGNS